MGLKPLRRLWISENAKVVIPIHSLFKTASPTIREQGLTAGSCGRIELSTVSTAVINTTNPKKLISLK